MATFTEALLAPLNGEIGLRDNGMRKALIEALEADEIPRALYSVSAHVWCDAVLTDRALLLVKGAMWAKVTRVPFPLEVIREPKGSKQSVRVMTPLGRKTLWGSRLDPDRVSS